MQGVQYEFVSEVKGMYDENMTEITPPSPSSPFSLLLHFDEQLQGQGWVGGWGIDFFFLEKRLL